MRIAVIGAGLGGLAAALRLQAGGHSVTLLEALPDLGGRARVFRQDGFTFDAGPTIITAPWMLEELFAAAGSTLADRVKLVELEPMYVIRFDDGSAFHYRRGRENVVAEVERLSPGEGSGYLAYLADVEAIYDAGMALVDRPFLKLSDLLASAPDLARLRADRSVAWLARKHFRDPRLQQVFSFQPLLIGGNPLRASTIYSLIHVLEQRYGVWFAMGGTGAVVAAIAQRFQELGGEIVLGEPVLAIETSGGRVQRVATASRSLEVDAAVSNADIAHTYTEMIPAKARPRNSDARYDAAEHSMSLFVHYFGTSQRFPATAHHEILLGPRYDGLLGDIFDRKLLAGDFSLYLHRPTATDPSLAPEGMDCWYVLSPVPNLRGKVDWGTQKERYRDRIMEWLERRYLPGLRASVVSERTIDPVYFRDDLRSAHGAAFSLEPTLLQSAWMRPHNRSEDLANLFFVGAGTHPGAGIPGVLSGASIVARLIGPA